MPDPEELRLGTRGSPLALWQANAVAESIARTGGPRCRIVVIRTSGDHLQNAPLSEVGGKRLFVKEIEDALVRREIDLAVHSSKDMPAVLPDGLAIAAVLPRADPHDAVVLPASRQETIATLGELVAALGQAPSIGTGSVRRVAQLRRLFTSARFMPIRGNLETRLRKLDSGEHDALVLAAAGLHRLGFAGRISFALPASACVPAPGQGIVAVEVRDDAEAVRRVVALIDDAAAGAALRAERALVEALGGGCQTPIGAMASVMSDETIEIVAAVVTVDGHRLLRTAASGPLGEAAVIGVRAARQLLEEGAGDILAEARQVHAAVEGIQP